MARQRRVDFPGGLYHVISRGIERRSLFRDDTDFTRYLMLLEKRVARFGCRIYAYCLMTNHVHLAVGVEKRPLSSIMRSLNTAYAGYFNTRHRRVGYLFQGRYKALLVDRETYLLSLVRYIHRNPVEAGMVKKAEEYRWSSHQSYLQRPPAWLSAGDVLQRFGRTRAAAIREFRRFFTAEESESYGSAPAVAQVVVGDELFAQEVFAKQPEADMRVKTASPADVIEWVGRREGFRMLELQSRSRRRELSRGRTLCGYLGQEVGVPVARMAKHFGLSQPNLWRSIQALIVKAEREPTVRRRLALLKNELVAHVNKI